jgi:hypothetical protein
MHTMDVSYYSHSSTIYEYKYRGIEVSQFVVEVDHIIYAIIYILINTGL